jgi:transporter family-2 protein
VAGQLLGALALDLGTTGHKPSAATWIGAVLTLAAVVLVARCRAGDS